MKRGFNNKHIGEDKIPYIFTTPKALLEKGSSLPLTLINFEQGSTVDLTTFFGVNTCLSIRGRRVTAGQIAYLKFETTTNQACCGMICKDVKYASYLYYYLLDNQNEIANMAIGGAQPNLSKAIIEELQIIKPKHELFEKHHFEEIINYREKIEKENMIICKAKDVILSKMTKA